MSPQTRAACRRQFVALTRVLPCVVCFSPADPLLRDSVNAGIFVLLSVTLLVLAGFAAFIVRIALRKPRVEFAPEEEFHAGFRTE